MLKLAVGVVAIALAGSASAAGWRSLVIDGSSEQAFAQSLEVFKLELSPARRYVLGEALKDIWIEGAKVAEAEQREYTADEYYRQLDGLRYEEVVKYTDPTGATAKNRYRNTDLSRSRAGHYSRPALAMSVQGGTGDRARPPIGWSGEQVRGATQADMLPPGRSSSGLSCNVAAC